MQEILDNALGLLRAVLRFRWLALLVAWVVATLGWTYVATLDDLYVARARIFVDSNRILKPLMDGIAIQPDVSQRVGMMSGMLLSRPNLEKLAVLADIDIEATSEREKEQLLDRLSNTVKLNGSRNNDTLYTVTYTHSDPKLAKRIVQSLITVFVESTLGDERQDSAAAQTFLDRQLVDYEARLLAAERRLSDFKRENTGKMPGESGGYYQRLDTMTNARRSARLALREAQKRRDILRRQASAEQQPTDTAEAAVAAPSPLDAQLRAQAQELSSLLVRYTDRHPRIAQLRESIAELERRRSRESVNATPSERRNNFVASPLYQELRALLAEAEARVAELEVRVVDFNRQVEELEATVDSIPKVEAQLQQLDRDYSIVKGQYETLLERRESARLSEQVEQNADDVKFRVIDPPFVPSRPSSPNKPLMSAAVSAAALGGGVGLSFLLSLLMPVFYDARTVAARSGRPVLGTVSRLRAPDMIARQRLAWVIWIALAALLAGIFALVMALHLNLIDRNALEPLLESRVGPLLRAASESLSGLVERATGLLGQSSGGGS